MKLRKLGSLLLTLTLILSPMGFCAWDATAPSGGSNASDIDTNTTANFSALESLLGGLSSARTANNLKIVRDSVTAVTVTADQLFLKSSTTLSSRITSVNETISITTAGVSGLRTGLVESSDTWYYIVIMRKSSDGTVNGILDNSTTPTLETGYDQYAVVGAVRNNSSSDFINFKQYGELVFYVNWQSTASGAPGAGSWSSIDLSPYVPSGISEVVIGTAGASGSHNTAVTNDISVATSSTGAPNKIVASDNVVAMYTPFEFDLITPNTMYWLSDGTGAVYVAGYRITKI